MDIWKWVLRTQIYLPLTIVRYTPYIEEGVGQDRFYGVRDLFQTVPGDRGNISRYISEALEGITEALEHTQGYIRGYSGASVSPMYTR